MLTCDRYLSDRTNERAEWRHRKGDEAYRARELEECSFGNETRPTGLRDKKGIQHPWDWSNSYDQWYVFLPSLSNAPFLHFLFAHSKRN